VQIEENIEMGRKVTIRIW